MTPSFRLFALGSNGCAQLGIGHETDVAIPEECIFEKQDLASIEADDTVAKIVAGGNHTLVLLKSGAVFAAGNNDHQRCGLPVGINQSNVFRRVVLPNKEFGNQYLFTDISATWEASMFIAGRKRVYVCGTGSKGELGLGAGAVVANGGGLSVPGLGGEEFEISSLSSGMSHTVLITSQHEVYGWGSCKKGELGAELKDEKIIWSPRRLGIFVKNKAIVTGRNFTVVFGDGKITIFGQDEHLGFLNTQSDLSFDSATAGWSTVYLQQDKRVKAFGRNIRGQIPPADLPDLISLAAGSEHCVGLTSSKQVVAWGWGEHGNCSNPTDAYGIVADRWNVLPLQIGENDTFTGVAAGCATSFVIAEKKP